MHSAGGSACESVPSEAKPDVSYVQGKSRICKFIHEKIKAVRESIYNPRRIQVVGLYGVGGIGKTTFCKAMCNEMWAEFNGKALHIELKGENDHRMVQTVVTRLTEASNEDAQRLVSDMYEYSSELAKILSKQRVFLAIDGVTDSSAVIAQAEALLRFGSWFATGSVVLVTARTLDLLEKMKTEIIRENNCFEMPELEEIEARSLLLYHAAPSNPVNEDVLRQCLQRCYFRKDDAEDDEYHYLPLALEVLSLQLRDDADQWRVMLEELDTSNQLQQREHPIFSILRKSFETLNKEDQILFMDAALFYPRNFYDDPSWKISTLNWLHMVHGGSVEDIKTRLTGLKEKLLLQSFDERSAEIRIHDVWREFAVIEANVGKQEPSLWVYDNDEDYQSGRHEGESNLRDGGWGNLQRAFIRRKSKLKDELNFSLCSNLTVLTLRNVLLANKKLDLTPLKCLKYLELNLRPVSVRVLGLGSLGRLLVLRWFYVPATSPCLQEIELLTNLRVLQLDFLRWKKMTDFSRLTFQKIDFSRLSLLRTFSIHATEDDGMRPPSFLRGVKFLMSEVQNWNDAYRWRIHENGVFMQGFRKLQSLQELDISRCACIKTLPGLELELVALLELKASGCTTLEEFPNLQKLQRLQRLDISGCFSIKALPGLDELVALVELNASGCCNLREFPALHKLQKLQRLDISVCSTIKALPGLGELVALLELHAAGCASLEELPDLQKLLRLQKLDVSWSLIKALPGLGGLVALQELRARDCFNLAELPDIRKLTSLRVLNLKIILRSEEFPLEHPPFFWGQRYELHTRYIKPSLIKAVPGLDELISLSKLTVDFGVFEDVPDLRKLTNLTKLNLRGWSSGAAAGVASLPDLEFLKISYCEGLQLVEPTGVSSLTSLRRLKLVTCDFEDVSCLSSLPAFQHLHVKNHGPWEDATNLKKLLQSVLALPSLGFTLSVQVWGDWCSDSIRDEMKILRARTNSWCN